MSPLERIPLATENMIAEIDGPIGWMTFNKPARRNAVSLDMWEAIPVILDRFEFRSGGARDRAQGCRRSGFCLRSGHFPVRVGSLQSRGQRAVRKDPRRGQRAAERVWQADHRDDPRLVHRRRGGDRDLL